MATKRDRLSDVATIQAMPLRNTDSTRYGIWVRPLEGPGLGHDSNACEPCVGDEAMSTAVKYLNRK